MSYHQKFYKEKIKTYRKQTKCVFVCVCVCFLFQFILLSQVLTHVNSTMCICVCEWICVDMCNLIIENQLFVPSCNCNPDNEQKCIKSFNVNRSNINSSNCYLFSLSLTLFRLLSFFLRVQVQKTNEKWNRTAIDAIAQQHLHIVFTSMHIRLNCKKKKMKK